VDLPQANDYPVGGMQPLSPRASTSEQAPPTAFQNLGSEMGIDVFGHVKIDQRGRNGDSELHHEMRWLDATKKKRL
jgi:hypothetical protein